MRIPIYGMMIEVGSILISVYIMSSCAHHPEPKQIIKPEIKYNFPNVLDSQPKIAHYPYEETQKPNRKK